MGKLFRLVFLGGIFIGLACGQPTLGGGTCTTASLNGNYWITTNARNVSATQMLSNVGQSVGMINFDGLANATLTVTLNSTTATGQPVKVGGSYNIFSDCTGSLALPNVANFNLVVFNQGKAFTISGTDNTNTITGNGGVLPPACSQALLSGPFALNANGVDITGTSVTGATDFNGLFQFDGLGNVSATWNATTGTKMFTVNATGTYTINSTSCLGTMKLTGTAGGNVFSISFVVSNQVGGDFQFNGSGPQLIFIGTAHPTFQNPGQAVTNGASFKANQAAPGAIFSIFGSNLGPSGGAYGSTLPLPVDVGGTHVSINGTDVPLFYAGSAQINAQMPVDIAPGLVTLVVSNGSGSSNPAAVIVPLAAPGIFTYGADHHAVVINANGQTNAENEAAHVGDTVVAYFTGGGPVNASGPYTTGAPAPGGTSPLTDSNSITVNGKSAQVMYMGLSGGSVGLYQANFVIPQVVAGDHPLVITVNGLKSNVANLTIAN